MTNKELINTLKQFNPELEVKFGFNARPHCDCSANDARCYCEEEEQRLDIHSVDEWHLGVVSALMKSKLDKPIILIQSEDTI